MNTYPDEKPKVYQTALPILCALISSGHYTFIDEETGEPSCYYKDNGKNWKDEGSDGVGFYTGRYSAKAVTEAMELAAELLRELDKEEEFKKVTGVGSY